MLSLKYNSGLSNASLKVVQKDGVIVYEKSNHSHDDVISFSGKDKGTLGTNIKVLINGIEDTSIHTSCSIEIGIGSTFGSFTVRDGSSLNGGKLCDK
ncbi:MAG: hypothetical protein ACJATA_001551 [Sphingobacteriales bacterium]|jgi:hypothetical protein